MYQVYYPKYPGWEWTTVSSSGRTSDFDLAYIISRMRKGVYTQAGYDLRLIPKKGNPRRKDCIKLGELINPRDSQNRDLAA